MPDVTREVGMFKTIIEQADASSSASLGVITGRSPSHRQSCRLVKN